MFLFMNRICGCPRGSRAGGIKSTVDTAVTPDTAGNKYSLDFQPLHGRIQPANSLHHLFNKFENLSAFWVNKKSKHGISAVPFCLFLADG